LTDDRSDCGLKGVYGARHAQTGVAGDQGADGGVSTEMGIDACHIGCEVKPGRHSLDDLFQMLRRSQGDGEFYPTRTKLDIDDAVTLMGLRSGGIAEAYRSTKTGRGGDLYTAEGALSEESTERAIGKRCRSGEGDVSAKQKLWGGSHRE
jgi:hypothetical protein